MSINNDVNDDWLILINNKDVKTIRKSVNKIIKDIIPSNLKRLSTRGKLSKQFHLSDSASLYRLGDNSRDDSIIDEKIVEEVKKWVIPEYKKRFEVGEIELDLISAWTVVGKKNSWHSIHNHNKGTVQSDNHIGVVIYLEAPKPTFHLRGNFFYMYEDNITNYIGYGEVAGKEGQVIIMPSRLWHGAQPCAGKRHTLNFEFDIIEL
tara:strand:- start:4167 stop:4784 length:618 start_codon:yes stop_codon:yes gene_type:complete